jgi:hypothetical protein
MEAQFFVHSRTFWLFKKTKTEPWYLIIIATCRKQGSTNHSEMTGNFIPPVRFNIITVVVVAVTLVMGILLPDIEFVLGIVSFRVSLKKKKMSVRKTHYVHYVIGFKSCIA